jgi:long-chain acyl-CoA synthetase
MIKDCLNNWHFDPVAGEYRPVSERTFDGTGEIRASELFAGRTMLVMGVTGFVGKVLVAMILDRFPEIRHLYIQIRPRKNVSGRERFRKEVLASPPLADVVARLGTESIFARTTIVEGDLGHPACGVTAEQLAEMAGRIDLVINSAGLVDFTPPLDESLTTNVYGIRNLIDLVTMLDARLVHISTAYVAGKKSGLIPENSPVVGYYPGRKGEDDTQFDVDREIRWCEALIESTADKEVLRRAGVDRADHWGWTNTYTYTKSLGEQLIARTPGLRFAIVRPAIVESAREFPFPGWNEGMTTSAPLVLMGGEGVKAWPVREDSPLEIIPVDLIAAGILVISAAILAGKNRAVYHLATAAENPVLLHRLVRFLGMNSRYKHKHKKDGNKLANMWKAYMETNVVSLEKLAASRRRTRWGLDLLQATFNFLKVVLGGGVMDPYLRNLRITRRQLRAQEQTLDMFLPFIVHNSFTFETGNIREAYRMLTSNDQRRLRWDPEDIDWADYWVNVHTKGIETWIRPTFAKQLRAKGSSETTNIIP